MTVRDLRHALAFVGLLLAIQVLAFAQSGPQQLGALNVTLPQGWTVDTSASPVRIYAPGSTPASYFSVEFPAAEAGMEVRQRHNQIWTNLSGLAKPGGTPQSGVTGHFMWTRGEMQMSPGKTDIMALYSAQAGSSYIGVFVDASSADLFSKNLPALEAMLNRATPAGGPAPAGPGTPAPGNAGNVAGPQGQGSGATGPASVSDYVFTPPPGWPSQQYPDGIVFETPNSVTTEKCYLGLLAMRPASGNLLADAESAFQDIYKGFEVRAMTNRGSQMPATIVHGISGQGWEYIVIRRGIAPPGSRESRLGLLLVANLGNRLAVIRGLSKDPLVSLCMGELAKGNVWPRFFYSLSFKNFNAPDQTAAMRKRIAGVWTSATATAADQITIAANGRFANAAARNQYTITSTELLTVTTGAFGNGSYTLHGNAITLVQDDRKNDPRAGFIRMEEESKDGGRTWEPFLYLLRTSTADGQEYEVRYHRTR